MFAIGPYEIPQNKTYVKMRLDHNIDGTKRPLKFKAEDGPTVTIDKLIDVERGPSTAVSEAFFRNKWRVNGHVLYLHYDGFSGRWFVEGIR